MSWICGCDAGAGFQCSPDVGFSWALVSVSSDRRSIDKVKQKHWQKKGIILRSLARLQACGRHCASNGDREGFCIRQAIGWLDPYQLIFKVRAALDHRVIKLKISIMTDITVVTTKVNTSLKFALERNKIAS